MSEEPDAEQSKTAVTLKTFKKWPLHEACSAETDKQGALRH